MEHSNLGYTLLAIGWERLDSGMRRFESVSWWWWYYWGRDAKDLKLEAKKCVWKSTQQENNHFLFLLFSWSSVWKRTSRKKMSWAIMTMHGTRLATSVPLFIAPLCHGAVRKMPFTKNSSRFRTRSSHPLPCLALWGIVLFPLHATEVRSDLGGVLTTTIIEKYRRWKNFRDKLSTLLGRKMQAEVTLRLNVHYPPCLAFFLPPKWVLRPTCRVTWSGLTFNSLQQEKKESEAKWQIGFSEYEMGLFWQSSHFDIKFER